MTKEEANEKAYTIMVSCCQCSWIENHKTGKMRGPAIKLRDQISTAILASQNLERVRCEDLVKKNLMYNDQRAVSWRMAALCLEAIHKGGGK